MATTQGNRQILDQKRWEWVTPAPVVNSGGACIAAAANVRPIAMAVASASAAYLYQPDTDGWTQVPSPALAGTFGAGTGICAVNWSVGPTAGASSASASAGTTTTITTSLTLARDLRGFYVHILSGPNAGATLQIQRNTIGANSVITVPVQGSAFSASTTFRLLTPRWFVLNAGTVAAGSFRFYDYATNTWTSLATTGIPATVSVDTGMTATESWMDAGYVTFGTGTSSGTNTSTTLNDTAKSWTANQWTNYQVRIVAGTGAGQIRSISSNTGTAITVSAAWTVTPDATSTYSIEGNDDFIYIKSSGSGVMNRYSVSANSTSALASSTFSSSGFDMFWIPDANDSVWSAESTIINGRRIYAPRGGGTATMDYYDIPSNTWVAGATVTPGVETFTTGSSHIARDGYIYSQKDNTGRWFRFNVVTGEQEGWTTTLYTQSTASVGNRAWEHTYRDGGTKITFVYYWLNSLTIVLRQMVF